MIPSSHLRVRRNWRFKVSAVVTLDDSVTNGKNQHLASVHFVHYPVITHTKFPILFESLSRRCSVLVGVKNQQRFNGISDPTAKVSYDKWGLV